MGDLVLAISGASGAAYAVRLLEILLASGRRVHLTISPAAVQVLQQELQLNVKLDEFELSQLFPKDEPADRETPWRAYQFRSIRESVIASSSIFSDSSIQSGQLVYHHHRDYRAAIASGSSLTDGMVICPCSMGTLASIATGQSNNLLHRAADVHLKERRKLIVVPRETPLSAIALGNMHRLAELGVIVMPAMPGFYQMPRTLGDAIDFIVGRICDQLGVGHELTRRWGEPAPPHLHG